MSANTDVNHNEDSHSRAEALDLYDIALLMNYERYTIEPRYRHTKLRDFASGIMDFECTNMESYPPWNDALNLLLRQGYRFELPRTKRSSDERDLPSNMLPTPVPAHLSKLSPKQLETLFYQARAHDACYASIALLQFFFALYPPTQPIRIRMANGEIFYSSPVDTGIATYELYEPNVFALGVLNQPSVGRKVACTLHVTGGQDSMPHTVMVFLPDTQDSRLLDEVENGSHPNGVLDLSSMQFGDAGRGLRGRSLFILQPLNEFKVHLESLAQEVEPPYQLADFVRGMPMDRMQWLKAVAQRVKERWDKRKIEHWCGHCGSPGPGLLTCSKCKSAWFCGPDHQKAAWPFHKKYCQ
ncbi:hypothetical protein FISHEDRAFT_58537 [Fistulina hepatica ATCC 64428]|uniref:MYND-type domain-containing protein n=1 Tax=Fistulina hepatica ATCC 64428 TaxID=1128425 RepID=A0A0D7ADI3_9AGAR|nr:hypothetical protein FISHEDRAFT_58537 [Fistulina hepatica ATCC 64428]